MSFIGNIAKTAQVDCSNLWYSGMLHFPVLVLQASCNKLIHLLIMGRWTLSRHPRVTWVSYWCVLARHVELSVGPLCRLPPGLSVGLVLCHAGLWHTARPQVPAAEGGPCKHCGQPVQTDRGQSHRLHAHPAGDLCTSGWPLYWQHQGHAR